MATTPQTDTSRPYIGMDTDQAQRCEQIRERALSFEDSIPRGERLVLYTEAYQQSEGAPEVLRRALAFTHYLRHVTARVYAEDQLAGLPQRRVLCHQGLNPHDNDWWRWVDFPEVWGAHLALRHPDLPKDCRVACQWWADQSRPVCWPGATFSPQVKAAVDAGLFTANGSPLGHALPDHNYVLRTGLRRVIETCRDNTHKAATEELRVQAQAMAMCAQAAIDYAERYARLAMEAAETAHDAEQAQHLREIAQICSRVPAEPPATFHEALQCVWVIHRLDEMEQGDACSVAHSFGRLDQYLYRYYEADLAEGRIDRAGAKTLLTELYLKLHRYYADQHIMLGGSRPDGSDGCNALTELMLEIAAEQRLLVDIGARVHSGTPEWFWRKWAAMAPLNLGNTLFGEEPVIGGLKRLGLPDEAAQEFAVVGCVEVLVPGYLPSRTLEHYFSPTKALELALNRGKCPLTGEQVGPMSVSPSGMKTMQEVWHAFAAQFCHGLGLCVEGTNLGEESHARGVWLPFQSCTYQSAVARAVDVAHGGATRNMVGVAIYNVADAADGLAAIERLVFEDQTCTMQELAQALEDDFAGYESLRQRLINDAPKYGNGDEAADKWARRIVDLYAEQLARYRNTFDEPFMPMAFAVTMQMHGDIARKTGATPNGRRAGASMAASLTPAGGMDRHGPTAAMGSVCAIDHSKLPGGTGYILELHPSALSGPDPESDLAALLKSFFDMGGSNLSVNITSPQVLRDAQQRPEEHRSLSVRVFGYSDYFVNLSEDIQEYIIAKYDR